MTRTVTTPDDPLAMVQVARNAARRAVLELARGAGAEIITRPIYPGAHSAVGDVDPLAGMRASRQLELAARRSVPDYIRQAREAGHTWHNIGRPLELTPDGDHDQEGATLAEAAYTYVAGSPSTETAIRYGRLFTWTCQSCNRAIADHGVLNGPADDERGHADRRRGLAATIATWDADWEAGQ